MSTSTLEFPFGCLGTHHHLLQKKCSQIHKSCTTPYPPSANVQVKRCNRTLMDAGLCCVDKAQSCWDEHLVQIAEALRSAVNRNLGFTASKLMLGREVNTPADLLYPVDVEAYTWWTLSWRSRPPMRWAGAGFKRMKLDYDLKVSSRAYEEGDLVAILDTATVKGKCRKLSPSWQGTGIVIKKLSPISIE